MYKISTESIGDVKKYVFHYRKGNKEYGPFTYEDILDLIQKREIGPDDYVWKFGNRKFIKASEIKGLFDVKSHPEVKQEEQTESYVEEPDAVKAVKEENQEESKTEIVEEAQKDFHIVFDNLPTSLHTKHKKESLGLKIVYAIVGILAACLAVWGIFRIL